MDASQIAAWRCEECLDWHPSSEEVHRLVVLEIGPDLGTAGMAERSFYPRRLRVCEACRVKITGEEMGYEPK